MTHTFNNQFGRGFGPTSPILLADGSRKAISSLHRGDMVYTPTGPAAIKAVVVCESQQVAQSMCWINGFAVTPHHPCRIGQWGKPAHLVEEKECYMPKVYNLLLESGHIVDVGGTDFATLAHGFDLRDPYFGTERVIKDLKKQPGWEEGMPVFQNVKVIRHPVTGDIDGWIESVVVKEWM